MGTCDGTVTFVHYAEQLMWHYILASGEILRYANLIDLIFLCGFGMQQDLSGL